MVERTEEAGSHDIFEATDHRDTLLLIVHRASALWNDDRDLGMMRSSLTRHGDRET